MFAVDAVPVPPHETPAKRVLEPIPRARLRPARMQMPVDGVTVAVDDVESKTEMWQGPKFVTTHVVSDPGVPGSATFELVAPKLVPAAVSRVKNGSAFSWIAICYAPCKYSLSPKAEQPFTTALTCD